VRAAAAALFGKHGLLAAFVLLPIQDAGVPGPVPGDFVILLLGVPARKGQVPLWQAIRVMDVRAR
jgi:hypothetical protein